MVDKDAPDWVIEAALEFLDDGSIETKAASAERDGETVLLEAGDVPGDAPVEPGDTWEMKAQNARLLARRRGITIEEIRS
jgi:hypothetical protein